MGQQHIHHLCIKLKHAFNARHPRTFVRDHPTYRRIIDILIKEGFLASVQPGDDRGPFVDILASTSKATTSSSSPSNVLSSSTLSSTAASDILTADQKERLEVYKRMRAALERLHASVGSDGKQMLVLKGDTSEDKKALLRAALDEFNWFREPWIHSPASSSTASTTTASSSTSSNVNLDEFLPPVSAVHVPLQSSSDSSEDSPRRQRQPELTPKDLYQLTPPRQRRLWLDLRYDQYQQPALTDMFIISKGTFCDCSLFLTAFIPF